ncbi:aflatoxin B1 aldehyde reductase member 4-like isoform X2 [Zophobas morio]|uniref:aflatoxin B1 aldehyde reductase member 4-like isoform X2 n=1 Tax=Zophobas morio TaxID=2755281 RepID=UPI0030834DF1
MGLKMLKRIQLILGTMSFGALIKNEEDLINILESFMTFNSAADYVQIDTARLYGNGETEKVLGRVIERLYSEDRLKKILIATKANPFTPDRCLSHVGINQQFSESLESLRMNRVDLFYLHAPDPRVPIEETLETVQSFFSLGKLRRFGLSNFTAWETVYIYEYMKARDWVRPTVYQGMYNAITRSVEDELFPALRKYNMSFYAYNPLAAGMLVGKYLSEHELDKGNRFNGDSYWAKNYRQRFMQKEHFLAVQIIKEACEKENVSMVEASLRWLLLHSSLDQSYEDGIVFGGSTPDQFIFNIRTLATSEPLPENILKAYELGWKACKEVCPSYSRGHSGNKKTNNISSSV